MIATNTYVIFQTQLRDVSGEATKMIKTATSKTVERSEHRSEAEQLRFRLLTIGQVSCFLSFSIVQPTQVHF